MTVALLGLVVVLPVYLLRASYVNPLLARLSSLQLLKLAAMTAWFLRPLGFVGLPLLLVLAAMTARGVVTLILRRLLGVVVLLAGRLGPEAGPSVLVLVGVVRF